MIGNSVLGAPQILWKSSSQSCSEEVAGELSGVDSSLDSSELPSSEAHSELPGVDSGLPVVVSELS